jgi:hypothetical protein
MRRKLADLTLETRLEQLQKDLRLLDRLTRTVHRKAIASDDNTAWGHLLIKCLERRSAYLSLDGPTTTNLHVAVEATRRPSTSEALKNALAHMVKQGTLSRETQEKIRPYGFLPTTAADPPSDEFPEPSEASDT